jgi:hypothetical protein
MLKIIFLDIDGVLATSEYLKNKKWTLNPVKQKLLEEIITATNANIVLSSSWRKSSLDETIKYMQQEGFLFSDKIIGVTIRAYQYIKKETKIHLAIPRGVEIKQWIDTHIHSNNGKNWQKKELGKDFNYVILDDDTDMLLEQKSNFIHINSEVGLTKDDVNKAIEILNKTCD